MRKSIVTEYTDICAFCGRRKEAMHHLLFGSDHKKADEDGLTIPVCNECHNMAKKEKDRIHDNPKAEDLSKMVGQLAWEKQAIIDGADPATVRDQFIKRYGRSYL